MRVDMVLIVENAWPDDAVVGVDTAAGWSVEGFEVGYVAEDGSRRRVGLPMRGRCGSRWWRRFGRFIARQVLVTDLSVPVHSSAIVTTVVAAWRVAGHAR